MLGVVGDLPGGCTSQLVGFTFDKILERERAVQVAGVLERAFNLNGALFGTDRGLLGAGTGHRVEAIARRFFILGCIFFADDLEGAGAGVLATGAAWACDAAAANGAFGAARGAELRLLPINKESTGARPLPCSSSNSSTRLRYFSLTQSRTKRLGA